MKKKKKMILCLEKKKYFKIIKIIKLNYFLFFLYFITKVDAGD